MKLVIVESPAKAKTIEKYLGDGFTVRASVGHVRDLPKNNKKAIDIEKGFVPNYEVVAKKLDVIAELTKLSKKSDEVILATDPDREGEAIAWHLKEVLGLKKPKRIVFNEITKEAVQAALKNPRLIDENLREAQEARRILDRLVGYDLSGLIWKKVRYGLSAGRVQSPALRILMEREREIRAFIPEKFWVITAHTASASKAPIEFTCSEEPKTESDADTIVENAKANEWQVANVKETAAKRVPKAPFTTSTMQQAASSRLGYAPSRTMGVAQKLYEAGLITYMRTDSTHLSENALSSIGKVIESEYGKDHVEIRQYKTNSKSAQEAHEAIRPSDVNKIAAGRNEEQKRLYSLIWARTVSSQMIDAEIARTKITASVAHDTVPDFAVTGSRVVKDGWLMADPSARGEDVELPKVSEGEALAVQTVESEGKETQPPPRYTEARLIKELEKRGIGRPSTYAAIMRTLSDRGYVAKEARALIPTDTGDVVSSFLEEHFAQYVSDTFTAEMEDELDDIAEGKREYVKTLKDFYTPFSKEVASKEDVPKLTNLGPVPEEFKCPECDSEMVFKLSKNGKFMSCAKFPDCSGARKEDGNIIEPPKDIGEKCPKCGEPGPRSKQEPGKLVMREGRFGMFISCHRYPKCKYIKQDNTLNSTGVKCTDCKDGELIERHGRFGAFYSCSNYPDCKLAIKAKPTGNLCPLCKGLMMEGTKTIPERCSDKTCPNHNPHKL
ncbi:type I DNA topoisomerase [Candidatus Kaiserbacteria bacterium]|nr:MAG: type I DNA topoisomerase [Candidatus Kaiserbacteria bacterium]